MFRRIRKGNKPLSDFAILGVGHSLPETRWGNEVLERMVDTSNEWIVERTGIENRHVLSESESLADLVEGAARAALTMSGLAPFDIDLIIVGTFTGELAVPSMACQLAERLGASCGAFDINAACSGFFYSLHTATQYIKADMAENVLIVGAEALTRVTDWEDRNTCVLFGDGAGAAVIGPRKDSAILFSHIATEPDVTGCLKCGGAQLNVSLPVQMDGKKVFQFATKTLPQDVELGLMEAGLTVDDVDLIVPHQANIRIIKSAAKRLKMSMGKFFCNIHKYGNTSAASLSIALSEAVRQGAVKRGNILVLAAFGGGLTHGVCVLKY